MEINEKDTAAEQMAAEAEEAAENAGTCETAESEAEAPAQADELAAAKEALAQKEKSYLYLMAEYDNYRKRTQKEKTDIYANAKVDAIQALLPVYDNLERALQQETADEAYKKGVELTMKGFRDCLSKLGVEEIPAMGQPFDPTLHNAVMSVDADGVEEDTIVDVFQTGFRMGERVIRFSTVKVAK